MKLLHTGALLAALGMSLAASGVRAAETAPPKSEAQRTLEQANTLYISGELDNLLQAPALYLKADDLVAHGQPVSGELCGILHFGLGVPSDDRRAYACALRQKDPVLLAHFHANGGPAARDVKKAAALLTEFRDSLDNPFGVEGLNDLLADLKAGKTVNIAAACLDNSTTLAMNQCASDEANRVEARARGLYPELVRTLDAPGKQACACTSWPSTPTPSWRATTLMTRPAARCAT